MTYKRHIIMFVVSWNNYDGYQRLTLKYKNNSFCLLQQKTKQHKMRHRTRTRTHYLETCTFFKY